MDDIDQALNNPAEEVVSEPTPPVDEPIATEEVETPSTESEIKTEEVEETKTETVDAPKKGAQSRIRELNGKVKGLEAKLAELTGSVDSSVPNTPYVPQIKPGEEVTDEQYKQDVTQTAMAATKLVVAQNNAINRINAEAKEITHTYPQLDPDSDSFDKELSDSVTEATEAFVKANPYTASPKKFVDQLMKPLQRAVAKQVGQETANIAKQVAESATRPTAVSTKGGKADREKTIQELEAELGIVQV